jgi:hypothetical protein
MHRLVTSGLATSDRIRSFCRRRRQRSTAGKITDPCRARRAFARFRLAPGARENRHQLADRLRPALRTFHTLGDLAQRYQPFESLPTSTTLILVDRHSHSSLSGRACAGGYPSWRRAASAPPSRTAPVGHTCTQAPHPRHNDLSTIAFPSESREMASIGQTDMHSPQLTHKSARISAVGGTAADTGAGLQLGHRGDSGIGPSAAHPCHRPPRPCLCLRISLPRLGRPGFERIEHIDGLRIG